MPAAGVFAEYTEAAVDTTANTVTCPAGHTVTLAPPRTGGERSANFGKRCIKAADDTACQDEYRRPAVECGIAHLVAHSERS